MKELEFHRLAGAGWSAADRRQLCTSLLQELWPLVPLLQPLVGEEEARHLANLNARSASSVCDVVGASERLALTCLDGEDPGGIASALYDLGGAIVGSCTYLDTAELDAFVDGVGGLRSATATIVAIADDCGCDVAAGLPQLLEEYERVVTASALHSESLAGILGGWRGPFDKAVRTLWRELPFERSDGYRLFSNQLGPSQVG